jgi:hypothetical protein
MRHRLATALLLVGLLLTGLTAVVAYLTRAVLNEDAFSSRVVAALDQPGVSALVAQRIADGVVAANRDLTGIKPVIATFAQAVVGSAPFRALVRRAAREAHHALLSKGAENVLLSVPDVGVLLRGTLETVSPEVARRVPSDVRAVIETRLTGRIATRVVAALHAAARVRNVARFGLIVGLLIIIGSVLVATERRQALLNTGIGLLAVAAVLGLVDPLGGAVLTGAVQDPAVRAAVGDLWSTFANGLHPWAIGLAAVALMVVSGATALLDRVALRDLARRAVTGVATARASRGREAGRVALLFVVGAFAIAAPVATLGTAVVAAGVLALVLAVHALVALVAPPHHAASAAPLHLNPALGIAVGCVAIMAVGLGGVALALRAGGPEAAAAEVGAALECNGAAALCDKRLDQITLAGAHNAQGSADNPHWLFPNQDANISGLLRRGVRAFMIDVWNGHVVGGVVKTDFAKEEDRAKFEKAIGPVAFAAAMRIRERLVGEGGPIGLYMCHGFCELGALPFDTALAQLKTFLVTNPSDVVMVVIEDYVAPADIAAAFARHGLTDYVYTGPSRGPFPTLRTMIAQNQRLFVMGEHETDAIPWYHPAFEVMQETPYTFESPEDFSCKMNRGERTNPIFLINHWIESTPAPRPSNAELVNAEAAVLERARQCERERGKLPNVIAVDFAATGDVVQAAAVLNGVAEPKPEVPKRAP